VQLSDRAGIEENDYMLRKATCWHRRTFFATLSVTLDSSRVDPNRSISRIFSTSLAALLQASPPEEPCVQAEKLPSYSYVLEESAKRVADPDTNVNSTLLATVFARKSEEEISKEFAKYDAYGNRKVFVKLSVLTFSAS